VNTGELNPTQWLGSALAASALLCLFGMAASFFVKTDGTFLGILFWQLVLGFSFSPALFVCSAPLIWGAWQIFKRRPPSRRIAAVAVALCSVVLIVTSNLPYFLSGKTAAVPYESLVVLAGVAVNIAVFTLLVSPPSKSIDTNVLSAGNHLWR
jgi:cation transport ATPase